MPKRHKVRSDNGFHERLFRLFMLWQGRAGRKVEQAELGELVAKAMHRKEPFTQATVSRWFTSAVPNLKTIQALAKVMGSTPGWLAFGEGNPPEDPSWPTAMPSAPRP